MKETPRDPSASNGEEVPLAGDALELVLAAIVELEAGADDEVLDRARDEDLAGAGERRDPCADVDREAGDVVRLDLDLADVEPGPDLEPELGDLVADRRGTADRPGRAVEGGQDAVADDLDLGPAEPIELAPDDPVVVREQPLPAGVAQFGRQLLSSRRCR